jgi:hypothetical protein
MSEDKISGNQPNDNRYPKLLDLYDHYIAIDWSIKNMSIARLTKNMNEPKVIDVPTNLSNLKDYLSSLNGNKILTIEETTSSQWLYVELFNYANKIVICDPYRNRLLTEGPKNDKIDASKLSLLLKNGLLKEVYHTTDALYDLRMLVSSYNDLVGAGVRLQNQKSAIYRAENKSHKKDSIRTKSRIKNFILTQIDDDIENYYTRKEEYEKEFERIISKNNTLRNLKTIPGIGTISCVTILAHVIDPKRFRKTNNYLSYCGLVMHEKMSGGKSYGKRVPRYSRRLKSVYRSAALRSICYNNPIKDYYLYLINEKKLTDQKARNMIARYIAKISLAIIKNGNKYKAYEKREKILKDAAA